MHKTYRYPGKNIRAFLKRIPHIRKKALDILSPSFPKNSVSKYTSVIPFDPLLDWQDIKHEAPTLATPEAFELYLCVLLAPLFSPNGKPKDSISKEWDKFISKYNSICLAHVPLDILIQFTYMPDDVDPDGSFGEGWSSYALSKYTQSALQLPSSKIPQNSCELREKGAQQAYRNYSSPVTSLISESAKAPFRFYTEICLHGSKTLKFLL